MHELHAREVSGDPCPRRGANVWVADLPGTLSACLGFEACVAHGGRGAASSSRRAGGWADRPRAKAERQAALRLQLRLRLRLRLHLRLRLRLRQSTARLLASFSLRRLACQRSFGAPTRDRAAVVPPPHCQGAAEAAPPTAPAALGAMAIALAPRACAGRPKASASWWRSSSSLQDPLWTSRASPEDDIECRVSTNSPGKRDCARPRSVHPRACRPPDAPQCSRPSSPCRYASCRS